MELIWVDSYYRVDSSRPNINQGPIGYVYSAVVEMKIKAKNKTELRVVNSKLEIIKCITVKALKWSKLTPIWLFVINYLFECSRGRLCSSLCIISASEGFQRKPSSTIKSNSMKYSIDQIKPFTPFFYNVQAPPLVK